MLFWKCPHPREFLDFIFETLRQGDHHAALLIPHWKISGFSDALHAANQKYRYSLDFPVISADADPLDCFRQCAEDPDGLELKDLQGRAMRKDNLIIALPTGLDASGQERWLGLIKKLSADAKEYHERVSGSAEDAYFTLPWRALFIIPSHFPDPEPETSLDIILADGRASQSDLEYAIENCVEEFALSKAWSRIWLEAVCQGLGIRDVSLCPHMFRELPMDLDGVMDALRSFPFPELDEELKRSVIELDNPAAQDNNLWIAKRLLRDLGILELDCHRVERLHPAALARAGRSRSIERLLVQGQARVYLPLAQEAHAFICGRLSHIFGGGWHTLDPANFPNPDIEIGPLAFYIDKVLKRSRGQDLTDLKDLAFLWREARNTIAHGRLLDVATAREAVELYEELRKTA